MPTTQSYFDQTSSIARQIHRMSPSLRTMPQLSARKLSATTDVAGDMASQSTTTTSTSAGDQALASNAAFITLTPSTIKTSRREGAHSVTAHAAFKAGVLYKCWMPGCEHSRTTLAELSRHFSPKESCHPEGPWDWTKAIKFFVDDLRKVCQ